MRKILHLFDIGKINVKECEAQLTKERNKFTIGFGVWMANNMVNLDLDYKQEHFEELLEIYKKQL